MIRITGGQFRGFQLPSASGRIRPTASRIRQALFDILGDIEGLTFADLFAGSGAVGIEAASRSAAYVEFVESDRKAAKIIYDSLNRLALPPKAARIRHKSVAKWVAEKTEKFDLIFADPPYIQDLADNLKTLLPEILRKLTDGGVFTLQLSSKLNSPDGWSDKRVFGDDILYFWETR